jgi:hypothetical protein
MPMRDCSSPSSQRQAIRGYWLRIEIYGAVGLPGSSRECLFPWSTISGSHANRRCRVASREFDFGDLMKPASLVSPCDFYQPRSEIVESIARAQKLSETPAGKDFEHVDLGVATRRIG